MFDAIRARLGSAPALVSHAFQLVMCAADPLRPVELHAAASQDLEAGATCKVHIDMDFVLEACRNLLVIGRYGCRSGFAYLSVQEYIEAYVWTPMEVNAYVAKVSVMVLNGS